MNLNLCSGPFPIKGFINADMVPYPETNVVCDARALPFKSGSLDGVFFCHAIEHFTKDEASDIIKDIKRVLKPVGTVHIEGPDLIKTFINYGNHPKLTEFIFGSLEEVRRDSLYTHKWGWTGPEVQRELKRHGFRVSPMEEGKAHGFPKRDYKVTGVKYGG